MSSKKTRAKFPKLFLSQIRKINKSALFNNLNNQSQNQIYEHDYYNNTNRVGHAAEQGKGNIDC